MHSSLVVPAREPHAGSDQARVLRNLMALRANSTGIEKAVPRSCHTIVISGGKGGVGRSVIALNLAVLLSQRGGRVGLMDASPDLGNIELLSGLNGYWNLSHVLQNCRRLDEVLLTGPADVKVLSGGSCLMASPADPSLTSNQIFDQLQAFEHQLDWLIVDASGGASSLTRKFALVADDTLIVTTPEPTAVAEAYTSVKSMALSARSRLGLLVNQADSVEQAQQILDRLQQAAHSFLHVDLHRRGYIPRDGVVPTSVNERCPFVIQAPQSSATLALTRLAQRWSRPNPRNDKTGFFSRLQLFNE